MEQTIDLDTPIFKIIFQMDSQEERQLEWKSIEDSLKMVNIGLVTIQDKNLNKAIKMLMHLGYEETASSKLIEYLINRLNEPSCDLKNTIVQVLGVYFALRPQRTQSRANFRKRIQEMRVTQLSPELCERLNNLSNDGKKFYITCIILAKKLHELQNELPANLEEIPRMVLVKEITENGSPQEIEIFMKELNKIQKSIQFQLFDLERDGCLRQLINSKDRYEYPLYYLTQTMINDQSQQELDPLKNSISLSGSFRSIGDNISRSRNMRATGVNLTMTLFLQSIPEEQHIEQQNTEQGELVDEQKKEESPNQNQQQRNLEEKKEEDKSEMMTSSRSLASQELNLVGSLSNVFPEMKKIRKKETTTDILFEFIDE